MKIWEILYWLGLGLFWGFMYTRLYYKSRVDDFKKSNRDLIKQTKQTIKEIKTQIDPLVVDFNKAKNEIAYKNKVEAVKRKLEQIRLQRLHYKLAESWASAIIVQMAEAEVDKDRFEGKLDELYVEIPQKKK